MSHQETMRRIQVGVIGISVIVILLSIASAIATRLQNDPAKTTLTTSSKLSDKPAEPMAKLGIAPADAETKPANVQATPVPQTSAVPLTAVPPATAQPTTVQPAPAK